MRSLANRRQHLTREILQGVFSATIYGLIRLNTLDLPNWKNVTKRLQGIERAVVDRAMWSRRQATNAILMALVAAPSFPESSMENDMTTTSKSPVVRVSILRCKPDRFLEFERMMNESAVLLLPGIRAMRGCRGYSAGSDQATSSLSNVSVWATLEDAKQMEHFQPMLDLGKRFLDAGATFERPIMNYGTLWQLANDE
jgi:hypothetical protein